MFDLFRFVMLRPAVTREPHEIISTADDTEFQRQLKRDRERPSPATPMEKTADRFLESEGAVSGAASLAFGKAYDALFASLRTDIPADRDALLSEIRNAFGLDAADLVDEQGFRDDRRRLADTLIAAKLGTPRMDTPVDLIARNLRLVALIQRAGDGDARLDDRAGISAALDTSIALPPGLLPIEPPAAPAEGGEGRPDERERRRQEAQREYRELTEAHDYLSELPPDHVVDAASSTTTGTTSAAATTHALGEIPDAIFREIRELRDAVLSRGLDAERPASGVFTAAARVTPGTAFKVRREALVEAPQAVHAGLRAARVDLATTSLSDAVDRINVRRRELAPLILDDLLGASSAAPGGSSVSIVGGQFLSTSQVPDLVMREQRRDDA